MGTSTPAKTGARSHFTYSNKALHGSIKGWMAHL